MTEVNFLALLLTWLITQTEAYNQQSIRFVFTKNGGFTDQSLSKGKGLFSILECYNELSVHLVVQHPDVTLYQVC